MKRYNLTVPDDLWAELEALAAQNHMTVVEILRRFIRLGLLVEAKQADGATLHMVEDGKETQIVLL